MAGLRRAVHDKAGRHARANRYGPVHLESVDVGLGSLLPNNPLVIEGYAANGMPDRRFLASRQRAVEVRQYLESHFHLNPKLVGVMPMADQPPRGAGKKMWDGICLVLVVSK